MEAPPSTSHHVDMVVIGAGVSGLAAAKCAIVDGGLDTVVFERTDAVGGLWHYREHGYGVMRFTRINVDKHNYAFSDFPYPDDAEDYPHHRDIDRYCNAYVDRFGFRSAIQFHTEVLSLSHEPSSDNDGRGWWVLTTRTVARPSQRAAGASVAVSSSRPAVQRRWRAKFVAIASGHHSTPNRVVFPGQDTFPGQVMHSVSFKDAVRDGFMGKRVLVVGIGNSACDIAVDAHRVASCVDVSTRSGAWVWPPFLLGEATSLHANRLFLKLPWRLSSWVIETLLTAIYGSPHRWGLNPKHRAYSAQPTVNASLVQLLQRGEMRVVPNIRRIDGSTVTFTDGTRGDYDVIVAATGYKVDVPFLAPDLRRSILDPATNTIQLYKNVFAPNVGPSLAFIGFVQPASGGIITMSETQARWFVELCRRGGSAKPLPPPAAMRKTMAAEQAYVAQRYSDSTRHTIQRDPLTYNDDLASRFGAKPTVWSHPWLALRLLLSSGGAAQWRLHGPGKWAGAPQQVRKVPVTKLWKAALVLLALLASPVALRSFKRVLLFVARLLGLWRG